MSGHSHSHEDAGHSHGHSHGGQECSGHDREPPSEEELAANRAEKAAFDKTLKSFYYYEAHSSSANNRRRKDFLSLSKTHQDILANLGYRDKLRKVDEAIVINGNFLREIADTTGKGIFPEDDDDDEEEEEEEEEKAVVVDDEKDKPHPFDVCEGDDGEDDEDLDAYYEDLDTSDPNPPHAGHSHDHDSHDHSHAHSHDAPASPPASDNIFKSKSKAAFNAGPKPSDFDMDKLRSTLKQFVRDWSAEGKPERDSAYVPLIAALNEHYKDVPLEEKRALKVLTPGAGLGRLAYDIALEGYSSQGNEFSYYMLLSSFFMLNRTTSLESYTIHPYIHSFSNQTSTEHMLRAVKIPDVNPAGLPKGSNFSLVAGDFLDVYGDEDEDEEWDAVITCFFIDTAKNIIDYLNVIYQVLKEGGVWINLGPLLWHFENNSTNDPSVELSLDEVKALCAEIGFVIKEEKTIPTTYTGSGGMLKYEYQTSFWTATKF